MPAEQTSLIVKALIIAAAALTLFAWWLSARNDKRTRALTDYLKSNHEAFWRALPWHARNLNPSAAIEAYRRSGEAVEPEFLELYEARRTASRKLFLALAIAVTPIAILLIGTGLLGWSW